MEQTLQALSGILLKAVPTILLLIFLHWYLKTMLFGPLAKILKDRRAMTDGARKAAEKSLEAAENKAAEFESKLQDARAQVYKEQEEVRKAWLADQNDQLAQSKSRFDASVKEAKQSIAADVASAKQSLGASASELADQIAALVLARRVG